ncbi:hypothetical protein B0H19DRAFT_1233141 [Mycena capillaripes]|nr:hypothetical protein B0H19DRAFT_1233141 [Mycena capillaripes]
MVVVVGRQSGAQGRISGGQQGVGVDGVSMLGQNRTRALGRDHFCGGAVNWRVQPWKQERKRQRYVGGVPFYILYYYDQRFTGCHQSPRLFTGFSVQKSAEGVTGLGIIHSAGHPLATANQPAHGRATP